MARKIKRDHSFAIVVYYKGSNEFTAHGFRKADSVIKLTGEFWVGSWMMIGLTYADGAA